MSSLYPEGKQQRESVDRLLSNIPPRPFPTYDNLSYQDFLDNHLINNTPFLLSASNTSSWGASRSFRHQHSDPGAGVSLPNLKALRHHYGHHIVPVANTHKPQYSEFERSERLLRDVIDEWERDEDGHDGQELHISSGRGLYVKDWHLMAEIDSEGRAVEEVYAVPECFQDDWLNPPYTPHPRPSKTITTTSTSTSTSTSDFRFTYLGPPLTYTPLHRDVYGSYSWSANIVGRKVWWIFPPDRLDPVKDKDGNLFFDVRELPDEGGAIKIVQEEGEIIFIPSGWHHQVLNLTFCLSLNHNFFSSPTLPFIYRALSIGQERVEESISDVKEMIIYRLGKEGDWEKEWVEEVQSLLEMDAGWNWHGFWKTILDNVQNPPAPLNLSAPVPLRNKWIRGCMTTYQERREQIVLCDTSAIVTQIKDCIMTAA